MKISHRHLADCVKTLHQKACRTCSTIIFLHSTNQIIDLWRCRWRCCHQILNSLITDFGQNWSRFLNGPEIYIDQVFSSSLASSGDAITLPHFLFGWWLIFVETRLVFQMDLSLKEGSIELRSLQNDDFLITQWRSQNSHTTSTFFVFIIANHWIVTNIYLEANITSDPSCCIPRVDKQLSGEINICYYSYKRSWHTNEAHGSFPIVLTP